MVGDEVAITVEGEAGVRSRQVEAAEDSRMVGRTFRAARDPEVVFALNGEEAVVRLRKAVAGARGWIGAVEGGLKKVRGGRRTSEVDTF